MLVSLPLFRRSSLVSSTSRYRRLLLLLVLGSVGYSLMAPTSALAACRLEPVFQVLICEDNVQFTADTNLWGPGDEAPPDKTIRLIDEDFFLTGQARSITDVSPFGSFGGSINLGINGGFGVYFGISGMNGGRAQIDYRALMRLITPRPNSYRTGSIARIQFGGIPDFTGSSLSATGELSAGAVSVWGEVGFNATAGGSVCVFDCAGQQLPSIGFDSFGNGGFPLPPGTSFEDGRARQLIYELPVGRERLIAGPVRDVFLGLAQGNCEPRRIEIEEFSAPYDKSGLSGCLGLPGFPTESEFAPPDFRSLVATRSDKFVDMEVDLDFWAAKIRGVPPQGWERSVGPPGFSVARAFIDGNDFDIRNQLRLNQTLTFSPEPTATLTFPQPVRYWIVRGFDNEFIAQGEGSMVTLTWGQDLLYVVPDADFQIQTSYTLPNTFSNDSELQYDTEFIYRIYEGGFRLGRQLLGFENFRICEPWPDFSCWTPGIYSPKIEFGLGPLKTFRQDLATFFDSTMFDNNQPPWSITGFETIAGSSIPNNPDYFPTLVLDVTPDNGTMSITEGEAYTLSTIGSFDRDGDDFGIDFRLPGGTLTASSGPSAGGTREYTFPESGEYVATVNIFVLDGLIAGSRDRRVPLRVLNAAPEVTINSDSVAEGQVFVLPFSVTDRGIEDRQTVVVNWGDGSPTDLSQLGPGGGSGSFSHVYADNGEYTVEVCATDDDGARTCETAIASVANVAPSIESINQIQTVQRNASSGDLEASIQFRVEFSDPGVADTYEVELVWSDGQSQPININSFPYGPPGSTTPLVSNATGVAMRTFLSAGTRTSEVCIRDDDNGEICAAGPSITINEVDLSLSGTSTPAPTANIGEALSFDYTVTNNSAGSADGVEVQIELPRDNDGGLTTKPNANSSETVLPFDLALQTSTPLFYGNALASAGDLLVVGAPRADSDPNDPINPAVDEGAVYLFYRVGENWQPAPAALRASDLTDGDEFGDAVAVSADAQTIVVGAQSRNGRDGGAYVYQRDTRGTADPFDDLWIEQVLPFSAAGALFGSSVAIEGDLMLIGAFGSDLAVVFRRDGAGVWTEEQQLREDPFVADVSFGRHVAVANGRLAVANGDGGDQVSNAAVTVFERNGGSWTATQVLRGSDVLGSDGGFAAGGIVMQADHLLASSGDGFGGGDSHFHAFRYNGSSYQLNTQRPFDGGVNDSAIGLDSDLAAVQLDRNTAQLIRFDGTAWTLAERFASRLSSDKGLAVNGNLVIGADAQSQQLGANLMGIVYSMQPCLEQPAGFLTCGLGTMNGGATREIAIATSIGCRVQDGTALSNSAQVDGLIFDPVAGNDSTSVSVDTVLPVVNNCGIDLTPPRVSAAVDGTLGSNGWYVSDVSVDWSASDPDSAINSQIGCGATVFTGDAGGQASTCEATSDGGTTSDAVSIDRDTTPPTITPVRVGTLGNNGWYTSEVTLSFDCADATSGIDACTPAGPVVLSANGANPPVAANATDRAGNSSSISDQVRIDTLPPQIAASLPEANGEGWYNAPVTVSFDCADLHSGIESCPAAQLITMDGANQSVNALARDRAGLETPLLVGGINLDTAPPTVAFTPSSVPNAAGWHRDIITVTFDCSDTLSGVARCPEPMELSDEGSNITLPVAVVDNAGNTADIETGPFRIDLQGPQIAASVSPAPNTDGLRALPVTVSFSCTDAVSGVEQCPDAIVIEQSGLDQSVSVEGRDIAGNVTELTVDDIDAGIPSLDLEIGDFVVPEGQFIAPLLARVGAPGLTTGTAEIDFGDGFVLETPLVADGTGSRVEAPYAWADDGVYELTIEIEPLIGDRLTRSVQVTVTNDDVVWATLELVAGPPTRGTNAFTLGLGQIATTQFDYDDPGASDSHTARVDWGDGTVADGIIPSESPTGPPSQGGMSGTVVTTHLYSAIGTYAGEACISDDDGAETCTDFSVSVEPATEPPVTLCSIDIGVPSVGVDMISVPLTATLDDAMGGEVLGYAWEDSDGIYAFLDDDTANATALIPIDGSSEYRLGAAALTSIQFSDGQVNQCIAQACALIAPDGTVTDCDLVTGPDADPVLEVEFAATIPTTVPGERGAYELVLTNDSIVRADNVALSVIVPEATVFEPDASTPPWTCTPGPAAGSECVLERTELAPADVLSPTFPLRVADPAPAGVESLVLTARGTAEAAETAMAMQSTMLDADPNLFVELTPTSHTPGELGDLEQRDVVEFIVDIGNRGSQNAAGVQVVAQIPSGGVIDPERTGDRWDCDAATSECTWIIGQADTGFQDQEALALVIAVATGNLPLSVAITDDGNSGPDAVPADNTAALGITVSLKPIPLLENRAVLLLSALLLLLAGLAGVRARARG